MNSKNISVEHATLSREGKSDENNAIALPADNTDNIPL